MVTRSGLLIPSSSANCTTSSGGGSGLAPFLFLFRFLSLGRLLERSACSGLRLPFCSGAALFTGTSGAGRLAAGSGAGRLAGVSAGVRFTAGACTGGGSGAGRFSPAGRFSDAGWSAGASTGDRFTGASGATRLSRGSGWLPVCSGTITLAEVSGKASDLPSLRFLFRFLFRFRLLDRLLGRSPCSGLRLPFCSGTGWFTGVSTAGPLAVVSGAGRLVGVSTGVRFTTGACTGGGSGAGRFSPAGRFSDAGRSAGASTGDRFTGFSGATRFSGTAGTTGAWVVAGGLSAPSGTTALAVPSGAASVLASFLLLLLRFLFLDRLLVRAGCSTLGGVSGSGATRSAVASVGSVGATGTGVAGDTPFWGGWGALLASSGAVIVTEASGVASGFVFFFVGIIEWCGFCPQILA